MNNLLLIHQATIVEDWIDYNGHLRDAFYFLLFSHATDALMDHIGLDVEGRAIYGHTLYTLEAHINYLSETRLGEQVQVFTQVIDHDSKRLHIVHHLCRPKDGELLAASEQMLMNIASEAGRAAKFATSVEAKISAIFQSHRSLPRPGYCGRVIGIRR
ncbi:MULTISPECIES: thioesterase family protein [Pseudomonas]|uniref:thioesterase family protein n=1 Tax=Pseudomonas TaxID=286 RepID=UPI00061F60EB|nr:MULTISPECIES: thioesterase family protein [Pseudomonas]KIY42678.1 4-hydroxybenzoyl-CoA thioesterase [Pseudomonas sp. 10-1B]MEB6587662.1 thioesterase family protein [Pseudomonas asiatica]